MQVHIVCLTDQNNAGCIPVAVFARYEAAMEYILDDTRQAALKTLHAAYYVRTMLVEETPTHCRCGQPLVNGFCPICDKMPDWADKPVKAD